MSDITATAFLRVIIMIISNKIISKAKYMPIGFTLIVVFLSFGFVYLRGQDRNWDLLNYHFYTGYALVHGRYLQDIAAANLQSFLNPLANVFAYLSLKHLPFPFSAWLLLSIQLFSIPAIVLIAREIGKGMGYAKVTLTEILALVLCVLAPLWWSELGTTFFSSTTAPLILWGVYLLLREFSGLPSIRHNLAVAGFLFGLAGGLKLTNSPFAVSATVSLIYLSYNRGLRHSFGKVSLFVFGGIVGYAITAWWNWYLWRTWGSPLFPLYNAIFKSPYFDLLNFRDVRWNFASVSDFITFIVQAAFGTGKTSEVPFADARLLIIALLLPGAILCRPSIQFSRQAIAFLIFTLSGFALWAAMLAYQRYVIPIELLLGLVVWIFVSRIVEREWARVVVLICLIALSAFMVRVPDWGHAKVVSGTRNPFSIEMPDRLSRTSARYLVVGSPISYVLPSFHSDSVFYGVGLSKQVNDLITRRLSEPSNLPLRIVARDHDANTFLELLKALNYDPVSHKLNCTYFKTGIGRYIVCEVSSIEQERRAGNTLLEAEFSEAAYLRSQGILWERGLSAPEGWGRWSEGDFVELGFTNCLPKGEVQLSVTGHAFGPNVGKPVGFVLGSQEKFAIFGESDNEVSLRFMNQDECANRLVIHIPESKSPQELGLSPDPRKLGLGLVRTKIFIK